MNPLALDATLPTLGTNCVLLGHFNKADCIWTRDQFLTLCAHMLNGNRPTDFLLVYRDKDGRARFSRSKGPRADRRASWSWDGIIGRAKSKVGIGFYPSNPNRETRWAAMDFDAHNAEPLRARGFALAAFELLYRQPQLYVVLGTSGSDGWHLFVFSPNFHPVSEWTMLLKQVAMLIGAPIKPGVCEIFPDDHREGALPYGIRAPGTWNPKTDEFGLIAYSSVQPLLVQGKEKESPFLSHATARETGARLHDTDQQKLYRGHQGEWKEQFAIVEACTRHDRLKSLVHHIFRQVGRDMARLNVAAQHAEARPRPVADLAEHLKEFDELWLWTERQWRQELPLPALEAMSRLNSDIECDAFRIAYSFGRKAQLHGSPDFPFPVQHVGLRLGVSHQYVTKLRRRFVQLGLIEQTMPAVPNRFAARFRWISA